MHRRLLAALSPLLLAACQLEPGGRCARDADCLAGQHCSSDICVSDVDAGGVGALCEVDLDCAAWASCSGGRCVLATEACSGSSDCPSWTSCSDHACVPLPGRCGSSADCEPGYGCDARRNTCVPSCAGPADCTAWQECGPASVCVPLPGHCDEAGGCYRTQTCADHACVDPVLAPLDPASVFLWGTLESGKTGVNAVARVEKPRPPLNRPPPYVGFGGSTYGLPAFITGTGELLYTQHESESGDRQRIRAFRQDSFVWDARVSWWRYPADTAANDPEVPTPGCEGATTLTSWVVQRDTGAVLYSCGGPYFDSAGTIRLSGYDLRAWQSDGSMLVTKTVDTSTTWLVLGIAGNEVPLTGFTLAPGDDVVAVRTSVTGFRLVVKGATGTLSLWEVAELVPAVALGDYPAIVGYTTSQVALEEDGDLHVLATTHALPAKEVVLRLTSPAATPPSETREVYSEAEAPALLWWAADPASFFVFADPGTSRLVSGP